MCTWDFSRPPVLGGLGLTISVNWKPRSLSESKGGSSLGHQLYTTGCCYSISTKYNLITQLKGINCYELMLLQHHFPPLICLLSAAEEGYHLEKLDTWQTDDVRWKVRGSPKPEDLSSGENVVSIHLLVVEGSLSGRTNWPTFPSLEQYR